MENHQSVVHGHPPLNSTHLSEQLEASERRYRELFLQEQRRARHLSLINEVQKCALATREVEAFLPQVTRAIGSHFSDCDVSFYLSSQWSARVISRAEALEGDSPFSSDTFETHEASLGPAELVLVASCGEFDLGEKIGTSRIVDNPAIYFGDDPVWFSPEARSFLSVPLLIEKHASGLIVVQSRESEVLDARDVSALQTACAIIAAHLQSSRLFRNMREINSFNQNLLNSMLHSLLVVDEEGRVQFVNERLMRTFAHSRDGLRRQPIEAIFGEGPATHHHLREAIAEVLETGNGREIPEVHVWTPDGAQIFDLRLFRVYFRGVAEAAILLINLTQRWRKTYQLQLMHQIGALFQGSLDIERVLGTVLTCITAGSALGFNRAFVFLFDENQKILEGRMALGPSSAEEAARIWSEISQRELSLAELLERGEREQRELTPLQQQTSALRIRPGNNCFPALLEALENKKAVRAPHSHFIDFSCAGESHRNEAHAALQLFSAHEIAIAPLVAKDRLVGVVFADNLYSGSPIEADDIQMLDTLAQQAGLTIDNALAYQALQDAQRELVFAERLVAVGEMSARVSHEIRNPLATIGGFARSILRKPEDLEGVKRKTTVVVQEVARLEELLTDLLDMARPRALDLKPHSINEILEHAILLAEADLRACNAQVERQMSSDIPPILVDRSRILQALLNTLRNGAQAMPDGGPLRVATRLTRRREGGREMVEIEIADSGVGISQRALKQVFDPFFSTKVSGSGLGLAVTKRIIQDHRGHIDVESSEGSGTTFVFSLPARFAGSLEEEAKQSENGSEERS